MLSPEIGRPCCCVDEKDARCAAKRARYRGLCVARRERRERAVWEDARSDMVGSSVRVANFIVIN
jgi:hypothetical protein